MTTEVMTPEQAEKVFDQLENIEMGERVEFGDDFSPGTVNVRYPKNLPGQKIRIYDTRSGYSSDVLPYMLPAVMKMQRKDGQLMYSRRPTVSPPEGTSWCFLHPDFPDRERVVAAGVGHIHCSKPVPLLSIVHATRHAETRHGDSFKIYQGYIADQIEKEEREFRQMQMQVMRQQLAPVTEMADEVYRCKAEGCTRFFDNANALSTHQSRDHKE